MNLPFFIAGRYLFAKKSHNVINLISIISAAGVAIGTAALIIIMSVFNGFNSLIEQMHSGYEPDLKIEYRYGKVFSASGGNFDKVFSMPGIRACEPVLEENVYLKYGNSEGVATAKGVSVSYPESCKIGEHIVKGAFSLYDGDVRGAVVGAGISSSMGIKPHFLTPLDIYFPDRNAPVTILAAASSLKKERVFPSGIFSVEASADNRFVYLPYEVMSSLTGYDGEVSYMEIYLDDPVTARSLERIKESMRTVLGEDYTVQDRMEQNGALFKMVKSEKFAIFLILFFIILIISCNIFGSLSMLVIEKKDDILTFSNLGMDSPAIKKIFLMEGWMISLAGVLAGTFVGVALSLAQQYFGIIGMPGNFVVDAYPVVLKLSDILITVTGCALIGLFVALLPLKFRFP